MTDTRACDRRRAVITLAAFVAVSLVLRLPFGAATPHHIDELNFLRALDRYDIAGYSPHAPGYPYYVACGRLVRLFVADGMLAYRVLNSIAAGVAAWALMDVARRLFGDAAARATALLAILSPLSWSYGFCALSYGTAAAVTALAMRETCRALLGEPARLVPAGLLIGAATGFRLEAPVFLFPVFAWATIATIRPGFPILAGKLSARIPDAPRTIFLATVGLLSVGGIALAIPVMSAGGLDRYRELSTKAQTVSHVFRSGQAYLPLLLANLVAFSTSAILVLGALWLPALLRTRAARAALDRPAIILLSLWAAPSLLYFVFLHQGQYGYWLPTLAQPVWIVGGILLAGASRLAVGSAVVLNVLLVLCGGLFAVDYPRVPLERVAPPTPLVEFTTFYLQRYTAAGIAAKDATALGLMERLDAYDPDTTWIFTSPVQWMDYSSDHVMRLLPKFIPSVATAHIAWNAKRTEIPTKGRTILILHADLFEAFDSPDRFASRGRITEFDSLREMRTAKEEWLWFEPGRWGIVSKEASKDNLIAVVYPDGATGVSPVLVAHEDQYLLLWREWIDDVE